MIFSKQYLYLSLLFLGIPTLAKSQVVGGQHAFEFLNMSNSPHVSALGGLVPASMNNNVSFALQNPALLNPKNHNELALNYNIYYAGIGIANLQYGYHVEPLKTNFSLGVQYLNYGQFNQTDIYGNIMGEISAQDYSLNLTASRKYLENWTYGATVKLANSSLGGLKATALLTDFGIAYKDTVNLIMIGLTAKNIGFTLSKYHKSQDPEPLPFDLQLGIAKRFQHIPLTLFLVGHHLYEWDVRYDNPEDKVSRNLFGNEEDDQNKSHFADKFFRHLNFGAELILAKRVTISGAYSHMRRSELGYNETKGLAGFSFGVGINLNKIQVRYAHSAYATAGGYNEIGFSLKLNQFFGIGKKTEPWGWNKTY